MILYIAPSPGQNQSTSVARTVLLETPMKLMAAWLRHELLELRHGSAAA